MWWSMISLRENLTLHIGQEKGFSPVWLLRCRLRCSLRPKALSQLDIGQVNFFVLLKFLILSPHSGRMGLLTRQSALFLLTLPLTQARAPRPPPPPPRGLPRPRCGDSLLFLS